MTATKEHLIASPAPAVDAAPVAVSLEHGEITATLHVSATIAATLQPYRASWLAALPDDGPSSPISLAVQFLGHLARQQAGIHAVQAALLAFELEYLQGSDIHTAVTALADPLGAKKTALSDYYAALAYTNQPSSSPRSALFASAQAGAARITTIFGGQGTANPSCVRELRSLYTTYRSILTPLIQECGSVLASLSQQPDTQPYFHGRPIDLDAWLAGETLPEDFVSAAPVSLPILGLFDLAHYCVICTVLGQTPGQVAASLHAVSGHSQGIVIAAAVARADSWASFYENARLAVELLFWIGFESHQDAPQLFIAPELIAETKDAGHGVPSPMLSVRGLERPGLDTILAQCNKVLPEDRQLHVALINARTNHIVAGPAASLCGLSQILAELQAAGEKDQTRIPFSQRKPVVSHSFLPISTPFHTPYLQAASQRIKARLASHTVTAEQLQVPVLHTATGADLRAIPQANVIDALVDAITTEPVDFPVLLGDAATTHYIVLGAGRLSELVRQIRLGYGQQIIAGSEIKSSSADVSGQADLFAATLRPPQPSWAEAYQPRLVQTANGRLILDTKLSRLLQVPPIITAGMTPTTVPWDVVAAVMNAGYFIELAGGGYHTEDEMRVAIEKIAASIPAGRGITCNLIYVNPKAIAWQTRLIQKLIRQGVPIDGLTIGAGVPSLEVAREYIDDLGIQHISFKPGSVDGIQAVLQIADDQPTFPIGLQWTGGRGGGHHSYEDFHAPILATYAEIRKRDNIHLIAGSGFGGGEDTYPYLSGQWSVARGYPAMPFDGILLGSRMMLCREAHTSPAVKQLIANTPGVPDEEWEKSYTGSAGGIITVRSEMGQPIHKLATRGVRLWADLDQTLFKHPRPKMVEELAKRKTEIITRLNQDYAKPWFGQDAKGQPADLADMTYAGVLRRLVELMWVAHQQRWIHPSYQRLVSDFALRTLERVTPEVDLDLGLLSTPSVFLQALAEQCSSSTAQRLHPDDAAFFLRRCQARGQKPVPFVPALDENFETWFKKDSLWQSEDIEAVVGQDPERVCILHGPVAVRYAVDKDESAQEILDGIAAYHTHTALQEFYQGDLQQVPQVADAAATSPLAGSAAVTQTFHAQEEEVSSLDLITASSFGWVRDLLETPTIMRAGIRKKNPFRDILTVQPGQKLVVNHTEQRVVLWESSTEQPVVSIHCDATKHISVDLHQPGAFTAAPAVLSLKYKALTSGLSPALEEIVDGRNDRIKDFYRNLWLGAGADAIQDIHATFQGPEVTLTSTLLADLYQTLGLTPTGIRPTALPMDIAIVIAWEPLVEPLISTGIEGDLLRLVHRSNDIAYVPGAEPFQIGDVLRASSQIQAIVIEPTGKSVVVKATIERADEPIACVTANFFIRGPYTDYASCFERITEPVTQLEVATPVDEALLQSRPWLQLDDAEAQLVGKTLCFQLETSTEWKDQTTFKTLQTSGTVSLLSWNGKQTPIGRVSFHAQDCKANPVSDFLRRRGQPLVARKTLDVAMELNQTSEGVQIPVTNTAYSTFSRDYNPIHISSVFARYVELPGTITHGMYTSAAVRAVAERCAAQGDVSRFRRWACSFVGMVLPEDQLEVRVQHVAMIEGRLLLKITAVKAGTDEAVIQAEAEVDQPSTVYVFTGQGSQSPGMGQSLYKSSPAARAIWDAADKFFIETYGWSVLELVRQNPTALTVHFRGNRGRQIKANYMAMTIDAYRPDGSVVKEPILPELTPASTSYIFADPRGLVFSTQFAQPLVLLLERAAVEDLRQRGVVQQDAAFAGHSLGEYGALASFGEFMPFTDLLRVVFYRGLAMQVAIERDDQGRTNFSMAAVNPARVGKFFSEKALRQIVTLIATSTNALLEIVNFNVEGEQYVCAGTLENLHALAAITDTLARSPTGAALAHEFTHPPATDRADLESTKLIQRCIAAARQLPTPVTLKRSLATIPLQGIDVPFHSAHLRPGVASYRNFLEERIPKTEVDPQKLVGKWIPNVMGTPFSLSREYIEGVYGLTKSPILGAVLAA
ncbi:sterigmatocystin biosynthesis fatty acid synthase subunit beta [Aspergillus ibericus CBS 121593]|uniref:Sterigmatocystin biosynthesis fatty acid synthase subunit beta n=1 Tax=Aspergillus ibericus CBS 121593 TaxID=1448316 RepID=A0A395GU91_9EURO|nr:sterigmatocystin biosynthesis fatty acid synthase subunit beta [Aspergillus ibericus CBS 121593]RAK98538.1 sterigmatocystin biosynthesis fatty acid synthase subunit beta [Aspergillus ibericus CBS 121593]